MPLSRRYVYYICFQIGNTMDREPMSFMFSVTWATLRSEVTLWSCQIRLYWSGENMTTSSLDAKENSPFSGGKFTSFFSNTLLILGILKGNLAEEYAHGNQLTSSCLWADWQYLSVSIPSSYRPSRIQLLIRMSWYVFHSGHCVRVVIRAPI